jgi:superfamily II DNA/RNA helicase
MSATFGGAKIVKNYLSEICRRNFVLYENHCRMTELVYLPKKPTLMSNVQDALVFVFSQKAAVDCAMKIASSRHPVAPDSNSRLNKLAEILEVQKISPALLRGVGIYHGGMFPKEKLLVESAFRERIIDVVCGTNALSLGVNLPAQTVIFAQLIQYHDEPISKNEFLQMAGRAGRKGLFDVGYVTWLKDSPYERRGVSTGKVFSSLCEAQPEQARVTLRPSYGRLLRKQILMETEAEYMAEYSFPQGDPRFCIEYLRAGLERIDRSVRKIVHGNDREKYRKILATIWYDEMEIDENLEMATLFFEESSPSALMASQMVLPFERNYLQALLKVKRFANHLPKGYTFRSMGELNNTVEKIDPTIYGFEEKIGEIEISAI